MMLQINKQLIAPLTPDQHNTEEALLYFSAWVCATMQNIQETTAGCSDKRCQKEFTFTLFHLFISESGSKTSPRWRKKKHTNQQTTIDEADDHGISTPQTISTCVTYSCTSLWYRFSGIKKSDFWAFLYYGTICLTWLLTSLNDLW